MVYGIIGGMLLLIDQFIKFFVTKNVELNVGIKTLIPGFLQITNIRNYGVAFGLFSNASWLRWILLILLLVFTAAIVFAFIKGYFRTGFMKVSAMLFLTGVLSNGIDRALFGYIPDMFEFVFVNFAIFNLADVLGVVGGILFAVAILTGGLSTEADLSDDDEDEEDEDDEEEVRRPIRRRVKEDADTDVRRAPAPSRASSAAAQSRRTIDETTVPVPNRKAPAQTRRMPSREELSSYNDATVHTVSRTAAPAAARTAAPTATRTAAPTTARTATPTAARTATPTTARTATPTAARTAAHATTPTAARTTATPTAERTAAAPTAEQAAAVTGAHMAHVPTEEAKSAAPAVSPKTESAAPAEEFDLDSILAEFK